MKKREIVMLSGLSLSVGMVLGFLISPIKQGIYNYAGNSTHYHYGKKRLTDGSADE